MLKVLAISSWYTEPFSRIGLIDTKRFKDVDMTVAIPSWCAAKWPAGYKTLCDEFPEKVVTLNAYLNFHHSARLYTSELSELLKKTDPDVIFIHNEPWSGTALQCVILRRLLKLKAKIAVFTAENQREVYPLPFRWIEKYVLKNIDLIITVVKEEAIEILRNYKHYKGEIAYVPLTVDAALYKRIDARKIREELFGISAGFVIGYMGRLVEEKGIDTMLKAMAGFGPDIRALIVGDGPQKEQLVKLADNLGVRERVCFLNDIHHGELPKYLNVMDALILPSLTTEKWKEQFGRVIIEAMACEVPVIGSSSGEIPVVIGNEGLVFKEGNEFDLKEKIMMISNDPALKNELGVKGRQKVLSNYEQYLVMENTVKIYKELASKTAK
jgi:glycosyltransferase involved in cell wall biosynthesis